MDILLQISSMSDLVTLTTDNDMRVKKATASSDSNAVRNFYITAFTRFVILFVMLYLITFMQYK